VPPALARTFAALAVVAFAGGATVTATTSYLVVSAVGRGVDQATAGLMLAVASAVGAAARALLGAVVDRYRAASLLLASALIAIAGVAAAGIAVGPVWTLAVGALLGSGIAGAWSGLMHYFVSRTAGPATAAATGRIQFGSFVGCAAGPVAFGALAATGSAAAPWLMLAAVGLLGGVVGVLVARRPPEPWTG
jgi:LPXTG-motif cell wall-anchored protein